jgi:hypothetical protein
MSRRGVLVTYFGVKKNMIFLLFWRKKSRFKEKKEKGHTMVG